MKNHDELGEAYPRWKELPIPPPFDADEREDLRADLIAMDSFYAGIARTVLNHGRIEHPLHDLSALRARFTELEPGSDNDRRAQLAAINYLDRLDGVRIALERVVADG